VGEDGGGRARGEAQHEPGDGRDDHRDGALRTSAVSGGLVMGDHQRG
jgi:hypothetical protein